MAENIGETQPVASPTTAAEAPPAQDVKTLESVITDTFKSSQPSEKDAEVQTESPVTETAKEEEQKPKEEATEKPTEQPKEDTKGPIPYERFQEVNQKRAEYEAKLQSLEPLAQAQQSIIDHCQRNNIAPEEFSFWANIAALSKNDPAKAFEMLKPTLAQWQTMTGDVLPPEYQKAVDAGEISQEYAKRLAAAEGRQRVTQQQIQQSQEQARQAAIAQMQQAFVTSLTSWAEAKKATDPDFLPKTNEADPDGKYELFLHRYANDAKNARINTVQDVVKVAEQTYEAVNRSLSRFRPQPANGKPQLRTSQSTAIPLAPPKTVDEAISRAAKKHGFEFTPR